MSFHESVVQIIYSVIFFPLLNMIVGILSCEKLTKCIWLNHFTYIDHTILGPYLISSIIFRSFIIEISCFRLSVLGGRSYRRFILLEIVRIVFIDYSAVILEHGTSSGRTLGCYDPTVFAQNRKSAFFMTMRCSSMCRLRWFERFALFGQLEKVWIIVNLLV